jgi:sugar lactone lactonase YvrE
MDLEALRTLAQGLDHPEAVALGPDGLLYAGGEAGQIYRVNPAAGESVQIADTSGSVLGLCLDSRGRIYACDTTRVAVLRISPESGDVDVYCDSAGGRPLRTPNWAVFEPDGTLWLSDSGTDDSKVVDGLLVRIPPGGGEGEVVDLPPLHFSNGLALAPDGSLFVVESFAPRISVVRAGELAPYAKLGQEVPDGLALDADGGVLISCWQPNRILRVPPGGGSPEVILEDWSGGSLFTPTNIAFFGSELRQLAIASLGGWAIRAIDTPWRGQPLNYPDL